MPPLSNLIEARPGLRLGMIGTTPGEDLAVPLGALGIRYSGESLRELNREEARRFLVSIFSRELAYDAKLMSLQEAEAWTDRVLNTVLAEGAKLVTNIDVPEPVKGEGGYGWSFSGTDATISIGLIAVSPHVIAYVWIEDED